MRRRNIMIAIGALGVWIVGLGCSADEKVGVSHQNARGGIPGPPEGRGEDEEGFGNNLSYPVVFAEGLGLTGQAVTDPTTGARSYEATGLRPLPTETAAYAELLTNGLPFFYSGNVADGSANGTPLYLQGTEDTWQAEWLDGSGALRSTRVDWSDGLTHQNWTTDSTIRIEHTLYDIGTTLDQFGMVLLSGSQGSEVFATTGQTSLAEPTVYTVGASLLIERIDPSGNTLCTVVDETVYEGLGGEGPGGYAAEVNGAGKVIFGYNLMMQRVVFSSTNCTTGVIPDKEGAYRITFAIVDPTETLSANVAMTALDDSDVGALNEPTLDSATSTSLVLFLTDERGGGSRRDGGTGGGGGGGRRDGGMGGPGSG